MILLATGWGPKYGGINSFNYSFAVGLRRFIGSEGRIICAVPNATEGEIHSAKRQNIDLFNIAEANGTIAFDPNWIGEFKNIPDFPPDRSNVIWVGHDVKSGFAAKRAAEDLGGRAALIMHMDYLAYQGLVHDGEEAWEKHELQMRLFQGTTPIFAVGPLLQRSCNRLTGLNRAHRLVPGFEITEPGVNKSPDDIVAAIMLGRIEAETDRIKQGQLAVAAFSRAVAQDRQMGHRTALSHAYLQIVGLDGDLASRNALFMQSEKHARQLVNILPTRYSEDRALTLDRMRGSNLALMPSWHEGFGLVGWEAISCEVPLVVSVNSGLFELVDEELGGAGIGCLHGLRIDGSRQDDQNFSDQDIIAVSNIILKISSNLARAKADARNLKKMLIDKLICTWEETARHFLQVMGKESSGYVSQAPSDPPRHPSTDLVVDSAASEHANSGVQDVADPTFSYLALVSADAKKDARWSKVAGGNTQLNNAIDELKSHNWYTQNPAMGRVRKILAEMPMVDDSQAFVVGRNIYQSADGSANDAITFMHHLRTELGRFPIRTMCFLYLGMLYEVYFDSQDVIRAIPKARHVEALFEAAADSHLRVMANQVSRELNRRKPGRYPVLPGHEYKVIEITLDIKLVQDELSPPILLNIHLDDFSLTKTGVTQGNETGWNQLRKFGNVIQVEDILSIVQAYFALPDSISIINFDLKSSIKVDEDLSLIE